MDKQKIKQSEEYKNALLVIQTLMPQIDMAVKSVNDLCDKDYYALVNGANSISIVYIPDVNDRED